MPISARNISTKTPTLHNTLCFTRCPPLSTLHDFIRPSIPPCPLPFHFTKRIVSSRKYYLPIRSVRAHEVAWDLRRAPPYCLRASCCWWKHHLARPNLQAPQTFIVAPPHAVYISFLSPASQSLFLAGKSPLANSNFIPPCKCIVAPMWRHPYNPSSSPSRASEHVGFVSLLQ